MNLDYRPYVRQLELKFFRSKLSRLFAELMSRKALHLYRPVVEEIGPLAPGARIADIGCGHATFLRMYLKRYPQVKGFGLDQSAELIKFARRRCEEDGVRAEFAVGDVHDAPLPEAAFDAMVSLSSIYLWRDPTLVINRLRRALKPGGRLLIYEVLPARTLDDFKKALFEQRFYGAGVPAYTLDEMKGFADRSDFRGCEIRLDGLLIRMEMRR